MCCAVEVGDVCDVWRKRVDRCYRVVGLIVMMGSEMYFAVVGVKYLLLW